MAILVNSQGGLTLDLAAYFQNLIDTGQSLIVAGSVCASSCTLVSTMPVQQVCLQPTVELRFHAAWRYQGLVKVRSEISTAYLMAVYPQRIRDWIIRKGGLTEPNVWRVMKHPETAGYFRICGQ